MATTSQKRTRKRSRLIPARIRRVRTRWRRRIRKARALHHAVKQAPSKVREGARKVRHAHNKAEARLAGAYRAARSVVRPDGPRRVHCPCGKQVPASEFAAHTKRHEQKDSRARRETEKQRAAAAKRMGRTGTQSRSGPKPKATRPRASSPAARGPTAASRWDAAQSAAGWLAVGGVLIALPLDGVGSSWMYAAGAGCALVGGGAYAAERRWGITSHADRETTRALRKQARAAGCTAACMTSALPAQTYHCPCGGEGHGSARKGRVA